MCASLSSDALLMFLDEIVSPVSLQQQQGGVQLELQSVCVCVCVQSRTVVLGAMPPRHREV